MENKDAGHELQSLSDARDKAFQHLFALEKDDKETIQSAYYWNVPEDSEQRFRDYVKTEVSYQKGKVEAAKPGFDTEAAATEMLFQNADNFLTDERYGKESLGRVLKRLYRYQKEREYAFNKSDREDNYNQLENVSEWNNVLTCEMLVADLTEKFLGKEAREDLSRPAVRNREY